MVCQTERLQFLPAWELPLAGVRDMFGTGSDEWGNLSRWVTVPLVGRLVLFTGKTVYGTPFSREGWWHAGYSGECTYWVSPDHQRSALLPTGPQLLDVLGESARTFLESDGFVCFAPVDDAFIEQHAISIHSLTD